MNVVALFVFLLPCVPAPPGKSTIAASDAMQGRAQVLLNTSYTERNCQLFSSKGSLGSASKYYSMTSNGLGKDCSYNSGKQYTSGTELHKVFANNKAQCCNACVATAGCVAASFLF